MELSEFKEQLILDIESTAHFRSEKAEQYKDDARNEAAAEGLTKLAASIAALPDDHPDLRRLWWEWYRPRANADDDLHALVEAQSEFMKRYGFDHSHNDPAEFLRELASALNGAGFGRIAVIAPESDTRH